MVCSLDMGRSQWLRDDVQAPSNLSSVDMVFITDMHPMSTFEVYMATNEAHRVIKACVAQWLGAPRCTIATEFYSGGYIRWRLLASFEHDHAVSTLHDVQFV